MSLDIVPVPLPGLKNSVIIIPFKPSPIGAIPNPLIKRGVKERDKGGLGKEREITSK